MRPVAALLLLILPGAAAMHAAEPPALARARTAYNAANYDAAIAAATEARRQPATADAAGVVLTRSFLERYRSSASPADLAGARDALRGIVHAKLSPRDQLDHLVGLGQVLFFGDVFGAAAELFESALNLASMLPPPERARLLDWWASALDREAQSRSTERRVRVYERIRARMEQELREDVSSAPASYWLAVAARGSGDVDRAWDAAVAAWVRLSLNASAADVRGDVDRLVTQALITELARQRPARDQVDAAATLRAQWESIKAQWP